VLTGRVQRKGPGIKLWGGTTLTGRCEIGEVGFLTFEEKGLGTAPSNGRGGGRLTGPGKRKRRRDASGDKKDGIFRFS